MQALVYYIKENARWLLEYTADSNPVLQNYSLVRTFEDAGEETNPAAVVGLMQKEAANGGLRPIAEGDVVVVGISGYKVKKDGFLEFDAVRSRFTSGDIDLSTEDLTDIMEQVPALAKIMSEADIVYMRGQYKAFKKGNFPGPEDRKKIMQIWQTALKKQLPA